MRNLGLDIARSIAILMVLISHSRILFSKFWDVQFLSFNGLMGVELFFVLSGFLIGWIIIRDLLEDNGSIIQFYLRRWFRTLPTYFLVLCIVILISIWNHQKWYYQHFLFIQNFNYEQLGFFGVSWSLSIEEWFYLLCAPSLFILSKVLKINKKILILVFCASVIILSIVAKIIYTYKFNPPWDAGIRKQVFLRMDSLMFGVMLAGIKYYFRSFYEWIKTTYLFWASLILLGILICYYLIGLDSGRDRINHSIIGRTIFFDAISAVFMIMIWALDKCKRINAIQGVLRSLFTFTAATSYSVYLIHLEILTFVNQKLALVKSVPLIFLFLSLTLVVIFTLAYGMYRFWEKPIMNLREKSLFSLRISKNNLTNIK